MSHAIALDLLRQMFGAGAAFRDGQWEAIEQQVRNLLGAFEVVGEMPSGPVLLVDDVIDGGWTLNLLAVTLRSHGSGPVYPFALAKASPRT